MRSAIGLLTLAIGLLPATAAAQSKKECADAYVSGQVSRKDGHLREARARFEVCAAASCPAALQKDCKQWLSELDGDIPTLSVTVTDEAGAAVNGAAVSVDGAPFPAGKASALDPGEHLVRVEPRGMPPVERRVTLAAKERNREVVVKLSRTAAVVPAPAPAPTTGGARAVPVAPIVLGATGVVAMGVFAALGAAGNAKKASLDASMCKPDCSPSTVSAGRSLYLGADVSLGVGLAALAAAGVTLILHLRSPAPVTSALVFLPSRGGGSFMFQF